MHEGGSATNPGHCAACHNCGSPVQTRFLILIVSSARPLRTLCDTFSVRPTYSSFKLILRRWWPPSPRRAAVRFLAPGSSPLAAGSHHAAEARGPGLLRVLPSGTCTDGARRTDSLLAHYFLFFFLPLGRGKRGTPIVLGYSLVGECWAHLCILPMALHAAEGATFPVRTLSVCSDLDAPCHPLREPSGRVAIVLGCFIWGPHDNRIPQHCHDTRSQPSFSTRRTLQLI